jgi:hypothetical protein
LVWVPSQNSSGGKISLGGITKRGDDYLRTLLIQGAKSAVMTGSKRTDRLSRWLVQLRARSGWQKAVVALATKNACILWTMMTRGTLASVHRTQFSSHSPTDFVFVRRTLISHVKKMISKMTTVRPFPTAGAL